MNSPKIAFGFSIILILVNLIFLYTIVGHQEIISSFISPGLTVGILGVACVITFAVVLTWVYVALINYRESK